MFAYSKEFRRDVLAAGDAGEGTRAAALKFDCSESWIRRIKQDRRETGKLAPQTTRNRTPTWRAWADWLHAKLDDRPDAYLRELKAELKAERGVEASEALIARALKGLGITRKKTTPVKPAGSPAPDGSAAPSHQPGGLEMGRNAARPEPEIQETLRCVQTACPRCGAKTWVRYDNHRTVATLDGLVRLTLKVRRCRNPDCGRAYRPEAEGAYALPQHEFGLDVIALIGALRYREHLSVPEMAVRLNARPALSICERTVTNLLDRYDELLAVSLADDARLRALTQAQGRVILALDGLQPDVGHEVLWVLRDCLSGEVLLVRSLLSSCEHDLAPLLREVAATLDVPIAGVVSDGQQSIRNAVATALPGVPHQLCQFHDLREAARPIYEADRHAKKELKKRVRGVRPLERALEARDDAEAEAARGYCAAVRSAITDDGRPPLAASGLKLHGRLTEVSDSLARVEQKRGSRPN